MRSPGMKIKMIFQKYNKKIPVSDESLLVVGRVRSLCDLSDFLCDLCG